MVACDSAVIMPPTHAEQHLLELVNEARLNPLAAASRYIASYAPLTSSSVSVQRALSYFDVDGPRLLQAFQALAPARPVVWSDALGATAHGHNALMMAADQQSHSLPGELGVGQRLDAIGYAWRTYGENIYVDDRTIDSHIKRVRKKFRAADEGFDHIETLYGIGYRYKEQ